MVLLLAPPNEEGYGMAVQAPHPEEEARLQEDAVVGRTMTGSSCVPTTYSSQAFLSEGHMGQRQGISRISSTIVGFPSKRV